MNKKKENHKNKNITSKTSKKNLNSEKTLDDIDNELEEVIQEEKSMDKNKKKETHKNTNIPTKKPQKNSKDTDKMIKKKKKQEEDIFDYMNNELEEDNEFEEDKNTKIDKKHPHKETPEKF